MKQTKNDNTQMTNTDREVVQEKITEQKAKPNAALLVMKKLGVKNLLKIGGGSVGVAVVATVLFPFLGAIMIFGLGVGCLAVIGAVVHAYNILRKHGVIKPVAGIFGERGLQSMADASDVTVTPENSAPAQRYKVWDTTQQIYVFSNEPTVAELLQARTGTQEEAEDLFAVEPNTKVSIVNDSNKPAIKVRIATGKQQGRVGWVCRSLLVKEEQAA